MTSKERVIRAINHQTPDRVPLGFAGSNLVIDKKLKKHFQLKPEDNDGLFEALGIDVRMIEAPYKGPNLFKEVPDCNVHPLWGWQTKWTENESGGYWDFAGFPLKDATMEDVEAWPFPNADDFDYDDLTRQCEKYKDYCIIYGNPAFAEIMNGAGQLFTMENIYMNLVTDHEPTLEFITRRSNAMYKIFECVLDVASDKIDLIWTGEDLGTQRGPMISLDLFRKHIRPKHQKFIDLATQHNIPVMIHSCGSSSWAFNDLIEMGMDVVDTLQPEAKDMAPAYLKENFGDKLCFHGCISTAGPLAYGTVDEITENVKQTLEIMMPGGGYIMAPTHMLQDNTPVENVIAAYDTVKDFGFYG